MLLEEFLTPLGLSQAETARHLGISYIRLNEIVNGRRGVTPDTALRLSRAFDTSPDLWLNLQQTWDLWHALHDPSAKAIERITSLVTAGAEA
jgi:addiction module HigA family antidote